MVHAIWGTLTLLALTAVAQQASDYDRLQGRWTGHVGRLDARGRLQEEGFIEIIFQGKTITGRKRGGQWMGEGVFTLDPANKTIDVQGVKGDYRERYLGTYQLKGDELRWATTRGGPRRAKLPPDNDDDVILILRRTQ